MVYSIVVTLFIASIGILRIQAQFEGLTKLLGMSDDERHIAGLIEAQIYNVSKNGVLERNHTGPIISYGPVIIRQNNKYGPNEGKTLGGPKISFTNNHFSNNLNGTNIYGYILIEENNTYTSKNESTKYKLVVRKIGNIYPDNPGKNDIHNPIVIRRNNIYLDEVVHPDKKSLNESKSNEIEKVQNNTEDLASSAEHRAINNLLQMMSPTDTNDYIPTLRNKDIARDDTKSKPDSADGEKFNSNVNIPSRYNYTHQAYSPEDSLYESKSNEIEKVQNNTEDLASSAEHRAINNLLQWFSQTDTNDYILPLRNEDISRDDTKSKPDSADGEKFNSHVNIPSRYNYTHQAYSPEDSLYKSKSNEIEKVQNNTEDLASSAEHRAINNLLQLTSPTDTNDYILPLRNEDIARDDTKSKPDSADGEKFNSNVNIQSRYNYTHQAYSPEDSLYKSKSNEIEKVQNNTEDLASSAENRAINNLLQWFSQTDTNDSIPTLRNEDIARDDTKSKPDSADGEKFNSNVNIPSSYFYTHQAYSPEDSLRNKQPSLSFDKSVYNFLYILILCNLFYN